MSADLRRRPLFWPTLILAIAAIGFIALRFTGGQKEKAVKAVEPEPLHDQALEKFNLTGFDEKGKSFWQLEGETAKIDLGHAVLLDENVTLRLKDDAVIYTDHVRWSQNGGVMTTASPVTVDHKSARIKGVGAYGVPDKGLIQINRRIEMALAGNGTVVTCFGPMKLLYKENKLIFYRNVKVKDARGELTSDRMDVFLNPEDKKIKEIVAVGNVVINRGTDVTKSHRAIYTVATGAVRLEGDPEVTIQKDSDLVKSTMGDGIGSS